jgi:hypothetical protein
LIEVRELRQDLRASLARVQNTQILLARLQFQQEAVTRASDRVRDAQSRLADEQGHQKHIEGAIKRMEDALNADENPATQKDLRDALNHSKSELEDSTKEEQQRQATEIEAGATAADRTGQTNDDRRPSGGAHKEHRQS